MRVSISTRPLWCSGTRGQQVFPPSASVSGRSSRAPVVTMASVSTADFISAANDMADAAATITSRYFRTKIDVDSKSDASPVTIADKQAEAVMRTIIKSRFPSHSIFGEEHGLEGGEGEGKHYIWILDPIDGTKSFITGKPLFGTLISLVHNGVPLLGVIDQPILKERWLGVAGEATTLNGAPLNTRPCPEVGLAYLYATTPHMFAAGREEQAFGRVRDACRIPMYGCDCYAYGLLASGLCDLVVEADLKVYDYMALVPIIEGAGGVMTDWQGKQLRWRPEIAPEEHPGQVVAAGDVRAHAQALQLLAWS